VEVDRVKQSAFALADDLDAFEGDWHAHRFHQLLYAAEGALRLTTDEGTWLLPPQRAAWISASVRHRVTAPRPVALRTVYLGARTLPKPEFRCRVFAATPLLREMVLGAMRWDERRAPRDPLARAYFAALAGLAQEWARSPGPFHLPAARGEELGRATAWILDHLDEPLPLDAVARAARTSVRTLTRRFHDELNLSFRDYVRAARMLRAVELLAQPGSRVTDVALAVGFASPSAFTAVFSGFFGEPPKDFRQTARGVAERPGHIESASP
jgi:AraC-like DNA-binding protein